MRKQLIISIAVILVFFAGIGGYMLGTFNSMHTKQQAPLSPLRSNKKVQASTVQKISSATTSATISPIVTLVQIPAAQVADSFYAWYTTCSGNPKTTCNYKNSPDVDASKLGGNIESTFSRGVNPIICAQNPPQTIRVDSTTSVQNNASTATVVESYGTGKDIKIAVALLLENNQWRITNITCPKP